MKMGFCWGIDSNLWIDMHGIDQHLTRVNSLRSNTGYPLPRVTHLDKVNKASMKCPSTCIKWTKQGGYTSLFRLKEKESPRIRLESKSPTVLRLCLVEQNQGFEALLVGAIVSAPWAPASVRYPLPTSLTVIHPPACPATDPQVKVKVSGEYL